MRLGIVLPQHDCSPEQLLLAATEAEEAGLDSVWVSDHLHGWMNPERSFLECLSALSAVAISTKRVSVGTLVLRAGLRPPAVVAAAARTINDISDGRLTLGLGSGDGLRKGDGSRKGDDSVTAERSAYGLPHLSLSMRRKMLSALVEHLKHEVSDIPLLIGGSSPTTLEVARSVGAWSFWGTVEQMKEKLDGIKDRPRKVVWGGMFPGLDGLKALEQMGVDEVAVAVGAGNFTERIRSLSGNI